MAEQRILVVGGLCTELHVLTGEFPDIGRSAVAERHYWTPEGEGLDTALALSRLGADCLLCAKTGDDAAAKELRGYLSDEKTDVRFVTPAHGCDTAVRVTVTDREGGRRSLFCPGAGGLLDRKDIEEAFISYPDAVLIQAGIPVRAAAAAAVTAAAERVPVFVMSSDGGEFIPALGRTECEIFSVAEEEIEACTGIEPSDQEKCMKACIVLSQAVKAKYIILRLGDGDRGYFLFDGKYYSFISACGEKKRRGIKTDGVFSAALVLEYMKSGGDIKRACGYAAVAAAAFVSRGGGLRAYPSADEIRRYTEKYAERAEEY